MFKKKGSFILVIVFILFISMSVIVVIMLNDYLNIKSFNVDEYQYYIDNFSSEDNLGPISEISDLLRKVEAIWINKYGEDIKAEKPYQVFYDEKTNVWLVQGTLRSNMVGGVANILVENDTGKVLAIWHGK